MLAAGAAKRFGSPKQRLLLEPVLARVREARSIAQVVVVAGAHELETDAPVVDCADWALGPGASLRCGLAAVVPEIEAAVVVLADGPRLAPAAIDRLAEAWQSGSGGLLAAAYGGERGHPVLIERSLWHTVPNEGARALPVDLIPCDDLGAPGDIDYLGDLPSGPERLSERDA